MCAMTHDDGMAEDTGRFETDDRDNTPVARITLRRVLGGKKKKKKKKISAGLKSLLGKGGTPEQPVPINGTPRAAPTPPVLQQTLGEVPTTGAGITVNVPQRPLEERKNNYGPALRRPSGELKSSAMRTLSTTERRRLAAGHGVAKRADGTDPVSRALWAWSAMSPRSRLRLAAAAGALLLVGVVLFFVL